MSEQSGQIRTLRRSPVADKILSNDFVNAWGNLVQAKTPPSKQRGLCTHSATGLMSSAELFFGVFTARERAGYRHSTDDALTEASSLKPTYD
jgi:hypothetical protein